MGAELVVAAPWWAWPLALFVVCFFLGIIAVPAGIGGGVLFVPIVGGFFPFHPDFVRGAGLLLALSGTLAAGPVLLRSGLASLRLAMPLALAGSTASFAGAMIGLSAPANILQAALGITVISVAILIWCVKPVHSTGIEESDPLGAVLRLIGRFEEPTGGGRVDWRTKQTPAGLAAFAVIGFLGGIFGLGAGFANVPALNLLMAAPLKVAVGSSGLIISIVNSTAAWVYINSGAVLPIVVLPSILGVMTGSRIGAQLLRTTPAATVRQLVIVIMLLALGRALLRGLGLWN